MCVKCGCGVLRREAKGGEEGLTEVYGEERMVGMKDIEDSLSRSIAGCWLIFFAKI